YWFSRACFNRVESGSSIIFLFEHESFRKTGVHFSGSCPITASRRAAQMRTRRQAASNPSCLKLRHGLLVALPPCANASRLSQAVMWRELVRAAYAIALARLSETLSRKPVVDSQRWSAPTRSARSLVM